MTTDHNQAGAITCSGRIKKTGKDSTTNRVVQQMIEYAQLIIEKMIALPFTSFNQ
jgi:hypothetical protein